MMRTLLDRLLFALPSPPSRASLVRGGLYLLFGLLLGKPMQIEEQLRRIISTAQLFQLEMADVGADIFRRAFGIQ